MRLKLTLGLCGLLLSSTVVLAEETGAGGGKSDAAITVSPAKAAPLAEHKADWLKANGYFAEGNRLAQIKKYSEAVAKFQLAIGTYPAEPHYHYNLALAYKHKGELQLAADEFKKTIELRHNDWRAWKGLANTYLKLARFADAQDAFENALQNNPPQNEIAELKAGKAFCASKTPTHN